MIKTCPICKKDFESSNFKEKFCSPACKLEGKTRRVNAQNKLRFSEKERICPICGLHFSTRKGAQKYCSKECAVQAKKNNIKKHQKTYSKYKLEVSNKVNVNPHGWLKYAIERGIVTQCPMCGEWTRSESGFCPKHENNH